MHNLHVPIYDSMLADRTAAPLDDAQALSSDRHGGKPVRTREALVAVALSATPKALQRAPGQLHTIDLPKTMASFKRQAIRHELGPFRFIAGADFSFVTIRTC